MIKKPSIRNKFVIFIVTSLSDSALFARKKQYWIFNTFYHSDTSTSESNTVKIILSTRQSYGICIIAVLVRSHDDVWIRLEQVQVSWIRLD